MVRKKQTKVLNPYPQGGKPSEEPAEPPPAPARDKSWLPGQKGQGGEGLSDGYGGSAGTGTGPSGPQTEKTGVPEPARRRRGP
jgi:hypothetical protein